MDPRYPDWQRSRNKGKMVFGVIIAAIGLLLLLKMFHLLPPVIYSVHFGWPLILIIVGIVIGVKSNFRNNAWWILLLIGAAHMMPSFYIGDVPSRKVLWALLLILGGLAMIFRRNEPRQCEGSVPQILTQDTDTVNIDVTFGGRKEIVTSHSFKGGRVRATFAGAEVNLAAAESGVQPMVLEVYASFAGVEIIVPSHWEIQNEINPSMGSVEDHRMIRTIDTAAEKHTLVLRGTCSFGSVEIKSY